MDDRKKKSRLPFRLSEIINLEHTSQFKLVKDPNSKRVSDLLIKRTKNVTLYVNLLLLCDTDNRFQLKRNLLKMMTTTTLILLIL